MKNMKTKAENPADLLEGRGASALIQAYLELCQLKLLYRQGWLRRGVSPELCESVAEHSFGVALLTLWLAQACFPQLDADKALRMALLHDFGEIYAGDLIPSDRVAAEEKHTLEAESVERVLGKLPGGEEYLRLWQEFEAGDSAEARLVRQVDRLEMGLQAGAYQLLGQGGLEQFFLSARQALEEAQLVSLLDEMQALAGQKDADIT
ncbi:MAG: HD domain-containing protein [Anaerolineales bacterium]|nr:HD domain-containing protein [Anaerolineales bacterium]